MAVSPLRERTARTESSRVNGTKRSRMRVTGGSSDLAFATSSAVRRIHWPLPSEPMREVFRTAGRALVLAAAARWPGVGAAAHMRVGAPGRGGGGLVAGRGQRAAGG